MATVTIKFQNSLNWYIWFTSTSYQCWLNPLKTQAIFIILAVLIIKRVQRVLPKLHAKRAIIRTLTVTYGTLQKNKRSSVLNLPKQRQVCPSLFFQFNMRISVIYGTLRVSCKRVVSVLSPLASNCCGGSHIIVASRKQKLRATGWKQIEENIVLIFFFAYSLQTFWKTLGTIYCSKLICDLTKKKKKLKMFNVLMIKTYQQRVARQV